jgi:ketosteroid isomerase-like protein
MAEISTRAAVADLYDAYARGDADRVAGYIDDDIDWVIYGPAQVVPFAGARQGKPAVLETLGAIGKDYVLERYLPVHMVVEGERAAVMSEVAFKQRSTGRMLSFHIADFMRFRGGRIVEFREFANTFDLVEQALGRFIEV